MDRRRWSQHPLWAALRPRPPEPEPEPCQSRPLTRKVAAEARRRVPRQTGSRLSRGPQQQRPTQPPPRLPSHKLHQWGQGRVTARTLQPQQQAPWPQGSLRMMTSCIIQPTALDLQRTSKYDTGFNRDRQTSSNTHHPPSGARPSPSALCAAGGRSRRTRMQWQGPCSQRTGSTPMCSVFSMGTAASDAPNLLSSICRLPSVGVSRVYGKVGTRKQP